MNYSLLIEIAKSLLVARWKQTLVASVAVSLAIAMFIALLSFMTGLNDLLDGLVLNRTPHIRLYKEIRPNTHQPIDASPEFRSGHHFISSLKAGNARDEIFNNGFIMQSLRKDDRVMGFTPRITAQVFFNYGTIDINGIVNGIDAAKETKLFAFDQYLVAGTAADLGNISNSIILGKGLADRLQVQPGDHITLTSARGDQYSLKVVGLFQSGINEFDKVQSYASMNSAQKLLGKESNYVTDIAIKLRDMKLAPGIAKEYSRIYDADAEDIQTANAQFETGSKIRTIISYAVGVTLLVVAGFGIYNILNMMIYEKMDSIAILKATGFSGKDVSNVFLTISLGIGLAGGLTGLTLGFFISRGIAHIPFTTAALPTVKTYPVSYDPLLYGIGLVFSLITTYMAGLFPARKAGRIDPVIIIRGK